LGIEVLSGGPTVELLENWKIQSDPWVVLGKEEHQLLVGIRSIAGVQQRHQSTNIQPSFQLLDEEFALFRGILLEYAVEHFHNVLQRGEV